MSGRRRPRRHSGRRSEPGNPSRRVQDKGTNPKQAVRFQREKVGAVRIDAIVDAHYAQATVTSGAVEKGDIVTLTETAAAIKQP